MLVKVLLLAYSVLVTAILADESPTRTFLALVPESERTYASSARDRFSWLTGIYEHLMDIDDEVRASHILSLLEGWGNFLAPTAPEYLDLVKTYTDKFVKFSLNLRQMTEIRRARCAEASLLGGVVEGPTDLCNGQRESEPERLLNDTILADVLRKDLRAAYQRLDAASSGSQLKMEMLLMSSTLQLHRRTPCVKLWVDGWNLLPEQKFAVLKAYWGLLFAWQSRDMSETMLLADPLLAGIRAKIPHGQGVAERILLAVGNKFTEARLAAYPGLLQTVRKCQARRPLRLCPLSHPLLDRSARLDHVSLLDRTSLLGQASLLDRTSLLDHAALLDNPSLLERRLALSRASLLNGSTLLDHASLPDRGSPRSLLDSSALLDHASLLDRSGLIDPLVERPVPDLELESRVPTPRMLLEDRRLGSSLRPGNHLHARRLVALRSSVPLAAGTFPGDSL